MDKKFEKGLLYLSYFFRLTIIIVAIISFYELSFLNGFLSVLVLLVTFMPSLIEKNYKITFPIEFEVLLVFFLYGTLFLGEFGDFYEKYWWWDMLLHTLSGIILGIIGFMIVYVLNYERKIDLNLSPFFIALFSLSFAISIGTIWEIFEYGMDYFFGLNMQKSGLVDTMHDLIVDTIGALIVSTMGYFYARGSHKFKLDGIIARFIEDNPRLFKK